MKIFVLGCGAYGTALSIILNENNNCVTMWTAFEEEANDLNKKRVSTKLPGVILPDEIKITSDIKLAVNCDFIVVAIPTKFIKTTLNDVREYLCGKPIVIASKGIEESGLFISDIVKDVLNTEDIAVISGPSFAIDVANKFPVGLTLAGNNQMIIDLVRKAFYNGHFKLEVSSDIIGMEICGSIKNVMAIACGILGGMNMPESTLAMFVTEATYTIKDLIKSLGGDESSVLSLAGIGDLLLTCTSQKSRNYSFGYMIGQGKGEMEIKDYISNTTVEGLYTLRTIMNLVKKRDINVPIIFILNDIIYNHESPKSLIDYMIQN